MPTIFGTNRSDIRNGTSLSDVIFGGPQGGNPALEIGNDRLSGRAGNDTIYGYGGNDILNGETGNDLVFGGIGNDILFGGNGNDILNGNADNDTLVGGAGADTMNGGSGVDTVNYGAEGGFRGVKVNLLGSGPQGGLPADSAIDSFGFRDVLKKIPNVIGTRFADTILGGNGDNQLSGGAGNDVLGGLAGNDALLGGVGLDRMSGGVGNDRFFFNTRPNAVTNVDTITDFSVPQDTIMVDNGVMAALGAPRLLNAAFFWKSTTGLAHDANDHIIYETDSGKLFYDSNGNAAGGAVQIAKLAVNLALTNADFVVI